MNKATFGDQKWENAISHLRSNGLATEESVREILLEGAHAFGLWQPSSAALDPLVRQVLGDGVGGLSPGLESWVNQSRAAGKGHAGLRRTTLDLEDPRFRTRRFTEVSLSPSRAGGALCCRRSSSARRRADAREDWVGVVDAITLRRFKRVLALVLTVISFAYAGWVVWFAYAGILEVFAWPIFFARAAGMGAAMITGLLYLTMSRTLMKQFYNVCGVNSKVLMVLDGHKAVHTFLGKCLGVAAAIHVQAHLLSTVQVFWHVSDEELNSVLGCANREEKLKGMPSFAWLQWPLCPLDTAGERMGWHILWQSTPGVTGLLLIALLALLGWTGRARARSANFDRFWYVHNFVLLAWPLTMFAHGSNQWIGCGVPLVALTASVPICTYMWIGWGACCASTCSGAVRCGSPAP
jgi:hypothetical protein